MRLSSKIIEINLKDCEIKIIISQFIKQQLVFVKRKAMTLKLSHEISSAWILFGCRKCYSKKSFGHVNWPNR